MRFIIALALAAGCTLTSKSEPLELRYFAPPSGPVAPAPKASHARLRLGRITRANHLRDAIVHRDSTVELAPYETLRWSDPPDAYLRRAAARALFDARPLDPAVGGDAPTLDLELAAFEEVRHGAKRTGRVEIHYVLRDEHAVIARGAIAVERDAANSNIESVVAAIGAALDAATADLGDRIAAAICP